MKVIDNFLPDGEFKALSNVVMGDHFPWYFNNVITSQQTDNQFYFGNTVFCTSPPWNGKTVTFYTTNVGELFLPRLKIKTLRRIKCNCQTRTFFHRKCLYHTDYDASSPCITAIFYVNTNNGWTEFKKGGKVKSVANRMVFFDSRLEHRGVSCTDQQTRVVINFNYDAG